MRSCRCAPMPAGTPNAPVDAVRARRARFGVGRSCSSPEPAAQTGRSISRSTPAATRRRSPPPKWSPLSATASSCCRRPRSARSCWRCAATCAAAPCSWSSRSPAGCWSSCRKAGSAAPAPPTGRSSTPSPPSLSRAATPPMRRWSRSALPCWWRRGPGAPPPSPLAALLAVAIGLSRIMLGVHWPSDVVAGWAFGLAWTLLLVRLLRRTPSDRLFAGIGATSSRLKPCVSASAATASTARSPPVGIARP